MNKKMLQSASLLSTICLSLIVTTSAFGATWKWAGFEVIGHKTITRDQALKFIPVRMGTEYVQDIPQWAKWCEALKSAHALAAAECSAVRYSDFKAYFTVEVIEKGDEYRIRYRTAPSKEVPLASATVIKTYNALQDRLWELFHQGNPPREKWIDGYLDYDDKQMHGYVLDLVRDTPQHRNNIIQVLREDKDVTDRMSAADLLNWALSSKESILETHALLDDPNSGVRNQLSRFMMHSVEDIHSQSELKRVIQSLTTQLDRPSHGDRNKALYNLLAIVKSEPGLSAFVRTKAGGLIKILSETSILSNVQEPAKELLQLLGLGTF